MTTAREIATRCLRALGVEPAKYWVLTGLFKTLGDRQEIPIGKASLDMRSIIPVYFGVSAVMSLIMLGARLSIANPPRMSLWPYLAICLFTTFFLMYNFLLSEMANLLVNPTEGLALAHQPIGGLTYVAAKLTHFAGFIVMGVLSLNLVPAVAPLFVAERANLSARWFYPVNHIAAALFVVLFVALLMCCAFGLLIRYMPPARLKEVVHTLQLFPVVLIVAINVAGRIRIDSKWTVMIVRPFVEAFLIGNRLLPMLAVVLGVMSIVAIRSLSMDYLSRAFSLVYGRSGKKVKVRRSRLGEWVSRFAGGQQSRAGFEFVRKMMARDWEFKRKLLPMLPLAAGLVWILIQQSASPFSAAFSPAHVLPHALGMALVWITLFLGYGSNPEGTWIFHLISRESFRPFVQGVRVWIWIAFVLFPHAALVPLAVWLWGVSDGILFVAFSAVVVSLYLSVQLRFIAVIPFSRKPRPAGQAIPMTLMSGCAASAAAAIGVQYFFLFRVPLLVLATTVSLGVAAYVITRRSRYKEVE